MIVELIEACPFCDKNLHDGTEIRRDTKYGDVHRVCELELRLQDLEAKMRDVRNEVVV